MKEKMRILQNIVSKEKFQRLVVLNCLQFKTSIKVYYVYYEVSSVMELTSEFADGNDFPIFYHNTHISRTINHFLT